MDGGLRVAGHKLHQRVMSKPNPFQYESEIQQLLWKAIEEETLYECIEGDEELRSSTEPKTEQSGFPQFSIDHLVRRACIRAGALVLESLNFLEPLTGDKNISFAPDETMRPDIVCINPEEQTVVIFELKKSSQTGRQAVTELLAYEHEIKNLLPFLSNYDVRLVLVSPEWSTLMDHAVASAVTWSGRQVLCLDAGLDKGKLTLTPRIPLAWTITGSVYFPEDALPSVTVCLYEKDAYSPENVDRGRIEKAEELDTRIWTAMEVIAREGDRMGGHGFALLWKDHLGMSLTSYNLTVVGVAPFAFYRESRQRQNIEDDANELVGRLDRYLIEGDPQGHSESLMATAKAAFPLLKEVADPTFEGFSTWAIDQISLRRRAEPLLCEFWGELGTYARAYVMDPAVRTLRRNTLRNGLGDWRDPSVGLPLIASFTKPQIFADGDVRCMDAFNLGIMVGLDRIARIAMRDGEQNKELACLFQWNRTELMSAVDEVRLLANAATNVEAPEEPFRFYEDPLIDDDDDCRRFLDWIAREFLQKSPVHIRAMNIGIQGALFFENERQGVFRAEPDPKAIKPLADQIRIMTREALELYKELKATEQIPSSVQQAFTLLIGVLGLRQNFAWKRFDELSDQKLVSCFRYTLEATDSLIPRVFHKHSPVAPAKPDWAWLQQGVMEMRQRGILDAGVILLPNGQVVTGPVLPEDVTIPIKLDDPAQQVPYMDRSNGIGVLRIVTWSELEQLFADGSDTQAMAKDPGADG